MLSDLSRMTQKLMTMDEAAWSRHANPLSGWSRVSILPLLAMAAWSRVWIGGWAGVLVGAVLIWTWVNPRLFPPPASIDNWMSKGVMGERVWLSRLDDPLLAHHRPIIGNLTTATIAGTLLLVIGLVLLNLSLTTTGLAVAMLSKLWILDRMVWIYSESCEASSPGGGDQRPGRR